MKTLSFFIFALALAWNAGAAEEQFPVGHPDQGLPRPEFVPTPYHDDPDHVLNRVFRASFLATVAPAEVGLALPREHGDPAEFFRKPQNRTPSRKGFTLHFPIEPHNPRRSSQIANQDTPTLQLRF
jgi:hypothetical protein